MTGPQTYEYRFEDHSILLRLAERPLLQPPVRSIPRRITPNQVTIARHLAAFAGFVVALTCHPVTAFSRTAAALQSPVACTGTKPRVVTAGG